MKILNVCMNFKPYAVTDAIVYGDSSVILPCGTILHLVHRDPVPASPNMKQGTQMYDMCIPSLCYLVYLMLTPSDHHRFDHTCIEMVISCGIAMPPPLCPNPSGTSITAGEHYRYTIWSFITQG